MPSCVGDGSNSAAAVFRFVSAVGADHWAAAGDTNAQSDATNEREACFIGMDRDRERGQPTRVHGSSSQRGQRVARSPKTDIFVNDAALKGGQPERWKRRALRTIYRPQRAAWSQPRVAVSPLGHQA